MKFNKIINKAFVALGATAALSLGACSDDMPDYWSDHYGQPEPEKPEVVKPRYIWVDAAANSPYLFNDRAEVANYVARAKAAGFTDMLIDVRPTNGDVLFKTDKCDQVKVVYRWKGSEYGTTYRTETWDYLQAFIDEGHKQDIRIHAAFNTMVGGKSEDGGTGCVYRDPAKREWVTVLNTIQGLKSQLDVNTAECIFLNPAHPEVQAYLLGLLTDLAKYPDLDGIVLDRGRYLDMRTDFSDVTRQQFEDYIGRKLANWPGDVLPVGAVNPPPSPTPYYKQWWEFRAKVMHDFIAKAAETVHGVNPDIQFGCYVGAWYGSYYQSGVNWASPRFNTANMGGASSWCSNKYQEYGYCDHIDILILGAYADSDKVYKDDGTTTMESYTAGGYDKTMGDCPLVIAGPDFGHFNTASKGITQTDLINAANSVDACINACDGYFLFDMIHLENSPAYWDAVKAGIDRYLGIDNPFFGESETPETPAE